MLISVITPSLNRRQYIRAALDSLARQDVGRVEHIIVDGGSTDGTVEMIRADYPDSVLIVEKDRNLYDAINKGLRAASGDVIGLLNTDDQLHPGALAAVRNGFIRNASADSVCGGCEIRPAGSSLTQPPTLVLNDPVMKSLRPGDVMSGLILLNSRFFRRSLFDRIGLFDAEFPILADRDFLARCLLAGMRTAVIDPVVYAYGSHSGSLTFAGRIDPRALQEATTMTRRRLEEATTPQARAFYRQWHAWAAGRELIQFHPSLKACGRTAKLMGAAFASDAGWPLHFLRRLEWHLRTRSERR